MKEPNSVADEMRSQADAMAAKAATLGPGQERIARRMENNADKLREAAKRNEP